MFLYKMGNPKKEEKEIRQRTEQGILTFARIGYMSKGIVYILAGILSLLASVGLKDTPKGTQGVLSELASKPFGEIMLWIVCAGMAGYVSWKLIQAVRDPENNGHDIKGIAKRAGHVVSGLAYCFLIYKAAQLAMHAGGGGDTKQEIASALLSSMPGRILVSIIGISVIAYGVYEIYSALKEKFVKKFRVNKMTEEELLIGKKAGKIGIAARGAVFCVLGGLIVKMAINIDSSQSIGIDGALSSISMQPYGKWLLGFTAVGLMLYGIFQIIKGKNRYMTIG